MPRHPPKNLTLLLPPPYRSDYQIASPTYFSTLHTPTPVSAYASEKYPSPIPISARTLTPGTAAGTIIFDSTDLYTPTSPAKPCIYANYLPADEYTLHSFIRKEREEHFRRLRQKWGVLFYWVVGFCVILSLGVATASFSYRYSESGIFEMLFPGLMATGGNGRGYTRAPEVLVVSNGTGYAISMPLNEAAYPLPGEWYRALCDSVEMKSMTTAEKRMGEPMAAHLGYYDEDKGYEGLEIGGEDEEGGDRECERTMTFVVDDWEGRVGGVGEMVMGLWMAYALAIEEKREFFVVGKKGRWAYGNINRYFDIPPPTNKCTPPPMSRSLPCPRNTAHRLVTPATFKDAFGHAFENQFEDAREVGQNRQRKVFEFLRTGYEAIPLKGDLQTIIMDRVHAIGVEPSKNVVAVQIRRGDRGAREWRWHKTYLPLARFMKVSLNIPGDVIKGVFAASEGEGDKWPKDYFLPDYPLAPAEAPMRIISSDDSDIFNEEEIKNCGAAGGNNGVCVRAQDRSVAVGQPGGFWAEDLNKMEREEREAAAVAYLVDFGVQVEALRVAKDGWVVCGYYGDMCRMLAVGMGWESAIEKGHWVNIDGDFDWFGMRW